MSANARRAPRSPFGLFWGWYVAAGGAASNFLVIGIATFGFGVFVRPMREELGWSVAAISLGISLRSFEQGLLAPVTGALVDRLGPRRMAVSGLLFLVAGLVMFAQAHTLSWFYASSLVIALGQSTASFTPFSAVIVTWFRRMRGRAMGILNTATEPGTSSRRSSRTS
ncbi:MAG: MFS transporter [Dehalococcoidia bacterium]|nr:MFS transporter [Dehalococcoidia bacterium]